MSAQDETQCRKCDGHGCIEGKFCDCTCGQLLASQEKHVAVAYNHETGQKEVFVDRKHETVRSGETRRSMTEPNEIVGHKTFAEGDGFRHEPLTRGEADVLLAAVDNAKRERAERMPDEKAAVVALFEAWLRLKELGWHEGIYCPKDGSHFQAITLGSTGIFECVCEGEWPDCTWTIFSDRDAYPSSQAPALIKKGEKP